MTINNSREIDQTTVYNDTMIIAPNLQSLQPASTEFAYLRALAISRPDIEVFCPVDETVTTTGASIRALEEAGLDVQFFSCPDDFKGRDSPRGQFAEEPAKLLEWVLSRKPKHVELVGSPHLAYYLLQARKTGLVDFDLSVVLHVVTTLGYRMAIGRTSIEDPADVGRIQMESAALAMADKIVVQSHTIKDWIVSWQHAAEECVAVAPPIFIDETDSITRPHSASSEFILFAGTATETKGITTFAYAIDRLLSDRGACPEIFLAGALVQDFPAEDFLKQYSEKLGVAFQHLGSPEHRKFLDLLSEAAVVVVCPRIDEFPVVTQECELLGTPTIMVAEGDYAHAARDGTENVHLVEHDHAKIASKICELLDNSDPHGSTGLNQSLNSTRRQQWREFATNLLAVRPAVSTVVNQVKSDEKPLVSICIAHHNRPDLLRLTMESLAAQTYPNIELIVVDDGSPPNAAAAARDVVESFENTTFIGSENRYLGATRNLAVEHSKGSYLLFKDDDNYAKPIEVSYFVEAALKTKADIFTCFSDNFTGDSEPGPENYTGVRRMPMGKGLGINLFYNSFGDSNCFVNRKSFDEIGGFSEHYKIGLDDHEFFIRAHLQGFHIEIIPKSLYYYRIGKEKMNRFHVSAKANENRIMSNLFTNGKYDLDDISTLYLSRHLFQNKDI